MSLNSTAALADWLEMLDRIDESVGAALVDAERRVEAAEAAEHPAGSPFRDGAVRGRIEQLVNGLESRFAASRELAAKVVVTLEDDERVVRSWQQAAGAVRERLTANRL